jgi:hypothetical protein
VALDDYFIPYSADGLSDVCSDSRFGHEDIYIVNSDVKCGADYGFYFLFGFSFEPFSAKADFGDAEACFS